jgi:hypothetical protein
MKTFDFHDSGILVSEVGARIRKLINECVSKNEKYLVLNTGYGSTSGICKTKEGAINSLRKCKKEKIIIDFFPGNPQLGSLFSETLELYKKNFNSRDLQNDGFIFIIIK